MNDDKNLNELEKQLVPSPVIDLSEPDEEADATEQVVDAMNK
ncbi:hypothetical protein ABNZ43_10940 [Weissella sp. GP1]